MTAIDRTAVINVTMTTTFVKIIALGACVVVVSNKVVAKRTVGTVTELAAAVGSRSTASSGSEDGIIGGIIDCG